MWVSMQRSIWRGALSTGGFRGGEGWLKRCNAALSYLFTAEDTSGRQGAATPRRSRYRGIEISGAIKTVFWMAVSILVVVWLGQA